MLVQGQIVAIMPPDYTDQWGNQYQTITVQTMQGNVEGRKASKTPYGQGDISKQVKWECEQAQNQRGPYNKFTLPPDPRYAQRDRQQAPQGSQQAAQSTNRPQPAPQGYSDRDASICRQTAGKVVAEILTNIVDKGDMPSISAQVIQIAKPIAEWFLTGKELMVAADEPQDQHIYDDERERIGDDDIPF